MKTCDILPQINISSNVSVIYTPEKSVKNNDKKINGEIEKED